MSAEREVASAYLIGADGGADILKERTTKRICRIPLYFTGRLSISNTSQDNGRDKRSRGQFKKRAAAEECRVIFGFARTALNHMEYKT